MFEINIFYFHSNVIITWILVTFYFLLIVKQRCFFHSHTEKFFERHRPMKQLLLFQSASCWKPAGPFAHDAYSAVSPRGRLPYFLIFMALEYRSFFCLIWKHSSKLNNNKQFNLQRIVKLHRDISPKSIYKRPCLVLQNSRLGC